MTIRAMVLTAAVAVTTTGCYFETIDDERAAVPGIPSDGGDTARREGACSMDLAHGCFDGNVVSMQDFFVEGTQFFNADALGRRFAELVSIENKDGLALVAGKDFELRLDQPLNNRSFLSGFTYDLAGDVARRDDIGRDGNFSINDLPEGSFNLRLQRPVRFVAVQQVTRDRREENADAEAVVETVETPYCATIYTDATIEIRPGTRTSESFRDFQLYLSNNVCPADGSRTTLSLPD